MNTTFSQKPSGKYIELTYNSNIEKLDMSLKFNSSVLCSEQEDADKLIQKIRDLETLISQKTSKENLPFQTPIIILTFMNAIDSIASGLDVRSSLSNEELADRFVNGYKKLYDEAYLFCCKIIKMYDDGEKNESYTKHWRDYDKHNELVSKFKFNLRTFTDSDFKNNLQSLADSAKKLADLFVKAASEGKTNSIDEFIKEQEAKEPKAGSELSDYEKVFCEQLLGYIRNSEIENIHAGKFPSSKTGDYSDVKVVTPYGEIPWNELSRISQKEMGEIKDSFRKSIQSFIIIAKEEYGIEIKIDENSQWAKLVKEHILSKKEKFYAFRKK